LQTLHRTSFNVTAPNAPPKKYGHRGVRVVLFSWRCPQSVDEPRYVLGLDPVERTRAEFAYELLREKPAIVGDCSRLVALLTGRKESFHSLLSAKRGLWGANAKCALGDDATAFRTGVGERELGIFADVHPRPLLTLDEAKTLRPSCADPQAKAASGGVEN
jgi:hypothetical protein